MADFVKHPETEAKFDELLAKHPLVVVDFFAEWCPPCKAIAPEFAKLAAEHADHKDRLAYVKVDVDKLEGVAKRYGISAMPTFVYIRDGKPDEELQPIRGADIRAIQANGARYLALAEALGKADGNDDAAAKKEGEDDPNATVFGEYHIQKHANWKTSLAP